MRVGLLTTAILGIWVASSSETSEIRPSILYDDMLPLVGLWLIAKWMTLSGYFMSKSVFGQHFLTRAFDFQKFNNCIKSNIQNLRQNVGQYSSFWQYTLFLDIRRLFLQECRQTGVRSLKSTNLPLSHSYISSKVSEITSALIARYDDTPFWISAGTNKDDLEWPWMPEST